MNMSVFDSQKLRTEKKTGRIWVDGCFDMVHFGHANFLRQAKLLGNFLVVGIHSDEEIAKHKGTTVFTEMERYRLIKEIKWVDEVVENAPYITTVKTLDDYKCDFCVHGDDLTMTSEGVDTYYLVKASGKYKEVPRTQGISTTGLVGRMLSLKLSSHEADQNSAEMSSELTEEFRFSSPWTGNNSFFLTTLKIKQFSNNNSPKVEDVIVYVVGDFDLFHVGHLEFLEKARSCGNYLLVGIFSDAVIKKYQGSQFPVMNFQERIMNVLAYKCVSDIILGAPCCITKELIDHFNIGLVCASSTSIIDKNISDFYDVPKQRKIFKVINVQCTTTFNDIIYRVYQNHSQYEYRNLTKERKESEAYTKLISSNKLDYSKS